MAQTAFLDYLRVPRPAATAEAWFATQFTAWREPVLARSEQGPWHNNQGHPDLVLGTALVAQLP